MLQYYLYKFHISFSKCLYIFFQLQPLRLCLYFHLNRSFILHCSALCFVSCVSRNLPGQKQHNHAQLYKCLLHNSAFCRRTIHSAQCTRVCLQQRAMLLASAVLSGHAKLSITVCSDLNIFEKWENVHRAFLFLSFFFKV